MTKLVKKFWEPRLEFVWHHSLRKMSEELQEHLNAISNEVDRVVVEGSRAHKLATKVTEAVEEGLKEAADDTPSSTPVSLEIR